MVIHSPGILLVTFYSETPFTNYNGQVVSKYKYLVEAYFIR
ncbi:hypothetical protein ACFSTE_16910 [Aquimarina hainanensis]|uniref:Uncharacterized protein n=1 Tax=Aquimarina hainanensis TaxID=1578017 RepID=A0ABW5NBZ1_9FLAO